ncbi:MAG: chromosomal replication initiator protein DnaA [Pseudomonadota bacterium]
MISLWEEVKEHVKSTLPKNSFSLWIDPITFLETKNNTLYLGCPNKFSLKWISENYIEIMEHKALEIAKEKYEVSLKVMALPRKDTPSSGFAESPQLALPNVPQGRRRGWRNLNHDFTFDRFVVGKCNEFAYSASKALALEGHGPCNPLFILANTGLGKSHLSQAAGQAILKQSPNLRVFYITAEDFVNEMVFALRNNGIDEFKNKYRRSCDVLLLEEVQFLSGKEKTQLELGYTLDALSDNHKRIIFTGSLLPKDIPHLSKELSSRLTSGVITTLDKPDYETRVKIIQKKTAEQHLSLSEEIIHLLAKHLAGDIRQIESALRCLKAKTELMRAKIDKDTAGEVIQCIVPGQGAITPENIKNLVCRYFKVDPVVLESKSRKKIHSYPRSVYVYLCRQHTEMTVEEIGRSLNRNHSTILYASEVIEHKLKVDRKVKNQVDFLSKKLKDLAK